MSKKDFRFVYLIVMWAGETCIHPNSDEFFWALGVRKNTYHRLESTALMMCKSLNRMTPEYRVETTKHHIDLRVRNLSWRICSSAPIIWRSLLRPQIAQRKRKFDFVLTAKRSSQCTGLHNLRCGHERRRVCGKTDWKRTGRYQSEPKNFYFYFI